MPSPICTPYPLPLLIPAPRMLVCCHHIISARRFCLTSEVNGRRSAERARVESSRVESRVEFGCQAAARECQAQRLPQQPPCHMHPAFTAAAATPAATAATQQRSSPHIAAAAHCRLVWLSSARNQVESETRASAVALPTPPLPPLPFFPCPSSTLWCSFDVASPSASSSARHHRHRHRRRPRLQLRLWIALFSFRGWACSSRRLRDTHRAQIHTHTHPPAWIDKT